MNFTLAHPPIVEDFEKMTIEEARQVAADFSKVLAAATLTPEEKRDIYLDMTEDFNEVYQPDYKMFFAPEEAARRTERRAERKSLEQFSKVMNASPLSPKDKEDVYYNFIKGFKHYIVGENNDSPEIAARKAAEILATPAPIEVEKPKAEEPMVPKKESKKESKKDKKRSAKTKSEIAPFVPAFNYKTIKVAKEIGEPNVRSKTGNRMDLVRYALLGMEGIFNQEIKFSEIMTTIRPFFSADLIKENKYLSELSGSEAYWAAKNAFNANINAGFIKGTEFFSARVMEKQERARHYKNAYVNIIKAADGFRDYIDNVIAEEGDLDFTKIPHTYEAVKGAYQDYLEKVKTAVLEHYGATILSPAILRGYQSAITTANKIAGVKCELSYKFNWIRESRLEDDEILKAVANDIKEKCTENFNKTLIGQFALATTDARHIAMRNKSITIYIKSCHDYNANNEFESEVAFNAYVQEAGNEFLAAMQEQVKATIAKDEEQYKFWNTECIGIQYHYRQEHDEAAANESEWIM